MLDSSSVPSPYASAEPSSLGAGASHFLLEAEHYTDPVWIEIEQHQIFEKTWLYVGDSDQLQPGQVWSLAIAHR
ncbi:MAG: hypothetical protein F6K09_38090, partial [Merismopedia sp. SIO2A8]|nr:hypothetical protein [Merismopedia sp. SIO2A8]